MNSSLRENKIVYPDISSSRLQEIPLFPGIRFYLKRDDLIHPLISGNKWRKLKYYLLEFSSGSYEGIVSMGGAYSNHLLALAEACNQHNIPCTGIVRGEELNENSNDILRYCAQKKMKLEFVNREHYASLKRNHEAFSSGTFFIPEGGFGLQAMKGCEEIKDEIPFIPEHIILPVGTGTTLAGVSRSYREQSTKIHGICAAGSGEELIPQLSPFCDMQHVQLHTDYTRGGFGKMDKALIHLIADFYRSYHIMLDPVYTAKTLMAISDMVKQETFQPGESVVMIHTGGMTGLLSETCAGYFRDLSEEAIYREIHAALMASLHS